MTPDTLQVDTLTVRAARAADADRALAAVREAQVPACSRWIFVSMVDIHSDLTGLGEHFTEAVARCTEVAVWGGDAGAPAANAVWFRDEAEWLAFYSLALQSGNAGGRPWFFANTGASGVQTPTEALTELWVRHPATLYEVLGPLSRFRDRTAAALAALSDAQAGRVLQAWADHVAIVLPGPVHVVGRAAPVLAPNLVLALGQEPLLPVLRRGDRAVGSRSDPRHTLTALLLAQRWRPELLTALQQCAARGATDLVGWLEALQTIARGSGAPTAPDAAPGRPDEHRGTGSPASPGASHFVEPRAAVSTKPSNTREPQRQQRSRLGTPRRMRPSTLPGPDVEHAVRTPDDALALPDTFRTRLGGLLFLGNCLGNAPLASMAARHSGWLLLARLGLRMGEALDRAEDPLLGFCCRRLGIEDSELGALVRADPELDRLQLSDLFEPGPLTEWWTYEFAARVRANEVQLDVDYALSDARLDLRLAGLDLDPGWVVALGMTVRFHYLEQRP